MTVLKGQVELEAAPSAPRRPRAVETQRLYAADWASFVAWCQARRQVVSALVVEIRTSNGVTEVATGLAG